MRNQLQWQCVETVSPRINSSHVCIYICGCVCVCHSCLYDITMGNNFSIWSRLLHTCAKNVIKKHRCNRKRSIAWVATKITYHFIFRLLANSCRIAIQCCSVHVHSLEYTVSTKISVDWISQIIWWRKIKKSIEFKQLEHMFEPSRFDKRWFQKCCLKYRFNLTIQKPYFGNCCWHCKLCDFQFTFESFVSFCSGWQSLLICHSITAVVTF